MLNPAPDVPLKAFNWLLSDYYPHYLLFPPPYLTDNAGAMLSICLWPLTFKSCSWSAIKGFQLIIICVCTYVNVSYIHLHYLGFCFIYVDKMDRVNWLISHWSVQEILQRYSLLEFLGEPPPLINCSCGLQDVSQIMAWLEQSEKEIFVFRSGDNYI